MLWFDFNEQRRSVVHGRHRSRALSSFRGYLQSRYDRGYRRSAVSLQEQTGTPRSLETHGIVEHRTVQDQLSSGSSPFLLWDVHIPRGMEASVHMLRSF